MKNIKIFLARLLGSRAVGFVLLKNRGVKKHGMVFSLPNRNYFFEAAARIFWGMYESAERRMIQKWLPSNGDVIELGGSVGFVSCVIQKKLECGRHIVVEPDADFCEIILCNVERNFEGREFVVVNSAYASGNGSFRFEPGESNVGGRLVEIDDSNGVETVSLEELSERFGESEFSLVMDIEGAEAMLFYEEFEALNRCGLLIVELHSTVYRGDDIQVEDMVLRLVEDLGFSPIDKDGNVFVFRKGS